MKIAVTYDNGNVFQHFGKTEFFKVYEVENNQVVKSEVIGSNGTGHGALAGLLAAGLLLRKFFRDRKQILTFKEEETMLQ